MANIEEIRKQYPQLSDQEFYDKFHDKYYSNIPKDEYYKKVGFTPPQQQNQNPDKANELRLMHDSPELGRNIIGGLLHSLQSMGKTVIPDLASGVPESFKNILPNKEEGQRPLDKFDAYKALGTEDQPFDTIPGFEQTLGELLTPGGLAKKSAGAVVKGAEAAKGLAKQIADKFSPGKHANSILEELGQGAKNSDEVSKSLTNDIRNAHRNREDEYRSLLNPVMEKLGNNKIVEKIDPLISTKINEGEKLIDYMKDLKIGKLYEGFKNNPTFNNAHRLQSELGVMIGDLEKNPLKTMEENRQLQSIKDVRDRLKDHIHNFLDNTNKGLSDTYKKASDIYRDNVIPYLSTKKLRDIIKGGKTTVKNIHQVFEDPHDIVDRLGNFKKIGPINKILEDLPEESKGKILFRKIGGTSNKGNMSKLAEKISDAENSGYGKYVTDDLRQKLIEGMKKKSYQNKLITTSKYGGGAAGAVGLEEYLRGKLMNNNGADYARS